MKKYIALILSALLCIALLACKPPQTIYYYCSLSFETSMGGSVSGEMTQSVKYGSDSSAVTAIPDEGYLFTGWSDGRAVNPRQDRNVTADITAKAKFQKKIRTFEYVYNNATGNNSAESVTLSYEDLKPAVLAVPQKENFFFDGWYLEPDFITRVTDENGVYYLGHSIFYSDSNSLYAKWTENKNTNYRILMVFVDEIHATLETVRKESIDVDYKMSLFERKTCELIPGPISKVLNQWFNGIITFEIDMYFTAVPLGYESFSFGMTSLGEYEYDIFADKIPEVSLLLKNYRSVTTMFSMNDYDSLLHSSAGGGTIKYASIYMEILFMPLIINNEPLDNFLNLNYLGWETTIGVFLHEFTHTVEQGLDVYEYHKVLVEYSHKGYRDGLEVTKLYLLKQTEVNGEKVGIPYDYWIGNINVPVNYVPNDIDGGSAGKIVIVGALDDRPPWETYIYLKVPFGSSLTIEAIPFEGSRFVKWSDGVTTAVRYDENIISYVNVTAIFGKA